MLQRHGSGRGEKRFVHADGHAVWTISSVSPIGVGDGSPFCFLFQIQDISNRKRMEREARRKAEDEKETRVRLEAVLSGMGEGLYQLDSSRRLVYLNPAAQDMLGYELADVRGRRMHDLIHFRLPSGEYRPAESCPLLTVIREGATHEAVEDLLRPSGRVVPHRSVLELPDHGGRTRDGAVVSFEERAPRSGSPSPMSWARSVERGGLLADLDPLLMEGPEGPANDGVRRTE
jgi:PAS domain S-box-containing protein